MEFLPSVPTFVSFVSEVLEAVECFEKNQKLLIHDMYVTHTHRLTHNSYITLHSRCMILDILVLLLSSTTRAHGRLFGT